MALWQFKIWFVPSGFVRSRSSLTKQECDEGAWFNTELPTDYQARLSSILPRTKSWSDQLQQWGKQDGDLIEVWLEGEKVESVEARIDCRNLNAEFIRQVFEIAHEWGFRLVYDRYRTVLPEDFGDFVRAIWESPNHRFMEDPAEWLPRLAKEVEEQEGNS
jgi:hypothetical protein